VVWKGWRRKGEKRKEYTDPRKVDSFHKVSALLRNLLLDVMINQRSTFWPVGRLFLSRVFYFLLSQLEKEKKSKSEQQTN